MTKQLKNLTKRIILALLYATVLWSAMYLYSSVFGKRNKTLVRSSSTHYDFFIERSTVFGWPLVERVEQVDKYRFRGWQTTLTDGTVARVERNAIRFEGGKITGNNLFGTNLFWWLVITSFSAVRALRKKSQAEFFQYGLKSILFGITVFAVFLGLCNFEFYGWSWLLLIPISFGVCYCIIEIATLTLVFAKGVRSCLYPVFGTSVSERDLG